MNEQQAQAQILQMKGFILKEAEEKRDELLAKANEECALERQKIVLQEKKKIQQDYDRKERQASVQKRIAYSHEYNGARLQVLKAQDECTQQLTERARAALLKIVADPAKYEALLRDLIVQAALTIKEHDIRVICRECDRALVKKVLPDAAAEFKRRAKTGAEVALTIDETTSLPATGAGGVILTGLDGRIVCSNTIEARLAIAVERRLPDIRRILFPVPLRKTPLATAVTP